MEDDFDDFFEANPWCFHLILMGLFVAALAGVFWPEKYVRDRDWSTDAEFEEQKGRKRWACGLCAVLLLVGELTLVAKGVW